MHYPQGPLDRGMQKIFRRDRRKILCFGIAGRRDEFFIRGEDPPERVINKAPTAFLRVGGKRRCMDKDAGLDDNTGRRSWTDIDAGGYKRMPSGDNRMDTAYGKSM